MRTDEFVEKIEKCEIGFLYNKRELFQYLLSDQIDIYEQRIGIVVAIVISEDFKPNLNFKRLELNKSQGNLISLDELVGKKAPICRFIDMKNGVEISHSDMVLDSKELNINKVDSRSKNDAKFHKCLFMINQLKVIKEFSSDEIIFSTAYVNYLKSACHENIDDGLWFTLKVEGNFVRSFAYKVDPTDGTHLPIIELGSPCPPIWHDGINP